MVVAGHRGDGRVRRRDRRSSTRRRCTVRRRARRPRRSRCSPGGSSGSPTSTARDRRRRHGADGRRCGRRARRRARRDRRASSCRGSTWSRRRSGSKPRYDGAELVVTGEGKLDASSLEGKVVGGVLGVGARSRRRRGSRSIAGQVTDDARAALAERAGVARARAHRSRLAGGRDVHARRAPRRGGGSGSGRAARGANWPESRSAGVARPVRGDRHDRRALADLDLLRFEVSGEVVPQQLDERGARRSA